MINDDFLELSIMEYYDSDEEEVVIHVHLRDNGLIVFNNISFDPVFHNGWLNIHHKLYQKEMTSVIRESEVKYITYYTNKREERE